MLGDGGCGQLQTTPTQEVPNESTDDNHLHHNTSTSPLKETTPPTNKEGFPPVERSVTTSSEGYEDYGLTESENGSTTEWEWGWWLPPTAVIALGIGFLTFYMFRKS